jgi:uncharacterized protein YdaU (DUF1376 family)
MKKQRPTSYQKFFWSDYFGDTYYLDGYQSGAYLHLIGHYWLKGVALPDNDVELAKIVKLPVEKWAELRPALEGFFVIASGEWRHVRIEHDLLEAHEEYAKKIALSKAGNDKRWGSKTDKPQDVVNTPSQRDPHGTPVNYDPWDPNARDPNHNHNQNHKKDTPLPPKGGNGFEEFWSAYSRKDSRARAEKAFPAALKKVGGDPSILVRAARDYSRQFTSGGREKQYQSYAVTWLNGECWNDKTAETAPQAPKGPTKEEYEARLLKEVRENPPKMMIPDWFLKG